MNKVFLIDIDGTICDDIPNEDSHLYATAKCFPEALKITNKWYQSGNIITFFTARESKDREVTEKWLKENGFNYHGLVMDKPRIKEEKGKSIISDIVDDFKLAPKFLFTFGTGITAFYEPISNLLNNSGFVMSEYQIYLLIITAIASIIGESDTEGLVNEIKEEGLFSAFETVKDFILKTEKLLKEITKKTLGAGYVISDILAFTSLLVPVMNILNDTINNYGISKNSLTGLFKGIILATITYSVKSIINRIKKKLN